MFVVVYVNVVIDGKRLCATTLAKFDYMRCEGDTKSGKDGKVWWAESNLCQTLLIMLNFSSNCLSWNQLLNDRQNNSSSIEQNKSKN